jgi:hypothetical protein
MLVKVRVYQLLSEYWSGSCWALVSECESGYLLVH